jgi:hypothetical protein
MNSVHGFGFVANCLNMIAGLSFMNSVTGSGFVAKCSNILQDNLRMELHKQEINVIKLFTAEICKFLQ